MIFYFLVHEERQNTYTQPILANRTKIAEIINGRIIDNRKKVRTIQKCVICFRIHNFHFFMYLSFSVDKGSGVTHID